MTISASVLEKKIKKIRRYGLIIVLLFMAIFLGIILVELKILSLIDPTMIPTVYKMILIAIFLIILFGYFWGAIKLSDLYLKKEGLWCRYCGYILDATTFSIVLENKKCPKCNAIIIK